MLTMAGEPIECCDGDSKTIRGVRRRLHCVTAAPTNPLLFSAPQVLGVVRDAGMLADRTDPVSSRARGQLARIVGREGGRRFFSRDDFRRPLVSQQRPLPRCRSPQRAPLFLTCARHPNPTSDGAADQIIRWTGKRGIAAQPGVLGIALDQATLLKHPQRGCRNPSSSLPQFAQFAGAPAAAIYRRNAGQLVSLELVRYEPGVLRAEQCRVDDRCAIRQGAVKNVAEDRVYVARFFPIEPTTFPITVIAWLSSPRVRCDLHHQLQMTVRHTTAPTDPVG